MNQKLQQLLDSIQQSAHLSDDEKNALTKSMQEVDKEMEITNFKLDRTEKVKRTTAILLEETIAELEHKRKAVEAQNRELEIESALERVRTVAMGMNKPDDMLEVCKTIALQLQSLGVKEIRNVQTAIFYEARGTYMNYEFYAKHDKTFVTETIYTNHEVARAFAEKMFKGTGEVFITSIRGREVKDWLAYQKTTNVFIDSFLENASSLDYYWHSLGPVALGISTYNPLNGEELQLFQRFLKVFDLSYRRYLDIEKAIAQAREAKIEAALEKVRSRSLAMHKSEELNEVVAILFEKLKELQIPATAVGLGISIEGSKDLNTFVCGENEAGLVITNYRLPFFENRISKELYNALEKQLDFFVGKYSKKEKNSFYEYLFEHSAIKDVPDGIKRMIFESATYTISIVTAKNVVFNINDFEGKNLTENEIDIFKRFAKVFDQAYTRFLDLQKAEAQAKEAKIESALERIRSRSLAMHHSSELSAVVDTLLREFTNLEFTLTFCIINLIDEQDRSNTVWAANPETGKDPEAYYMKFEDYPFHHAMWDAWKEQQKNFIYTIEGEEKKIYDEYLYTNTEFRRFPKHVQEANKALKRYVAGFTFFKHSGLQTVSENHISDDELDILERFGRVFEQSYTRFLDLQKAEAQARESQIQLALERVRARTMAMQHSEELAETAYVLFQQFSQLGDAPDQITIGNINEEERVIELWLTMQGALMNRSIKASIDEPIVMHKMYVAWKEQQKSLVIDLTGQELQDYTSYRNKLSESNKVPVVTNYSDKRRVINVAFFSKGLITFSTTEPKPTETIQLLERFANVFEQTYTRFLDLQKAEAQAKEAQVELALERVRARTMAMQHSEELMEASNLLFQQVQSLGIPVWTCGYNIWEKGEDFCTGWMSTNGEVQPSFRIPLTHGRTFMHMNESRIKGEPFYVEEMGGEALAEHYRNMLSLPDFKSIADVQLKDGFSLPTFQINHVFNFKHGNLIFISGEPVPNAWDIFKRFTAVFEQTYTRFLDLQKAEAQTRESQIEAALERVRSRSMGMQKSEELKEVIKIVYQQLIHLKINLDHAGFVVDYKPKGDWHFWIADEQDIPSKISHPYFESVWANQFNEAKEKGIDFFTTHLDFDEKNNFYQDLLKHIPELTEQTKDFYFSCAGLGASTVLLDDIGLYIENFSGHPYSAEENNILMRFAKVFQQTYTRFLDLQKAEAQAREAKIEAALERTRTQSMIMKHSTELDDTLRVFHQQVLSLGILSAFSFLWLPDEEKDRHIFWAAWGEDKNGSAVFSSKSVNYPLDRDEPATEQCLIDWKGDDPVVSYHVPPSGVANYFAAWQELIDGVEKLKPEYFTGGLYYVEAFMKYGCFGVMVSTDLTEDEKKILGRFAIEFERAYTRFLDLQKAEAQARESQIQLALERVRARAMAMQHSGELREIPAAVHDQLQGLGFTSGFCSIVIMERLSGDMTWWMFFPGKEYPESYHMPFCEHPFYLAQLNNWKQGEKYSVIEVSGEEKKSYDKYTFSQTEFVKIPIENQEFMMSFEKIIFSNAYMKHGAFSWGVEPIDEEHSAVLQRFASVFEQCYTRFLDLQKAEAQAREAQIEAALERVRGKAMAMHNSDDLSVTVSMVFTELRKLDINPIRCGVGLLNKGSHKAKLYAATSSANGDSLSLVGWAELSGHPVLEKIYDIWLKNEDYFPELTGAQLQSYYSLLLKGLTVALPDSIDGEKQYGNFLSFSVGCLYAWSAKPYGDSELKILKRFAAIVDLTFRRYIDLQKAEAQAREAQIEAGLERVRSRSLAMHNTSELQEVIHTVHKELLNLKIAISGGSFITLNSEIDKELRCWGSGGTANTLEEIILPIYEKPFCTNLINGIKNGPGFFTEEFSQSDKKKFFTFLFKHEPWSSLDDKQKKETLSSAGGYTRSCCVSQHTSIFIINHFGKIFSEDDNEILKRFAKVFEQAYTRFLDLQKAETQVREAKIEAALERVRSRTMAMHNSEDVGETVATLFDELVKLDVHTNRCGILIANKENMQAEVWTAKSNPSGKANLIIGQLDLTVHPLLQGFYQSWKNKQPVFIYPMFGEDIKSYYRAINAMEYYPTQFDLDALPEKEFHTDFYFADGAIFAFTPELIIEEVGSIFKRFSKVFGQTDRRYLDLQKAEAQVREAQIQLALERVRARTMAMQRSDELSDAATILFQQVKALGVPQWTCGFNIWEMGDKVYTFYPGDPDGHVLAPCRVPLTEHWVSIKMNESRKRGEEFYMYEKEGEQQQEHYRYMLSLPGGMGELLQNMLDAGMQIPTFQIDHFANFSHGNLMFITYEHFPQMHDIFKRFAKVFEQTYTRFLDLKKAEAQGLEAIKRASVDRVRAEIASMRTTSDLERITPLIWRELTTLGIPFIRCGVFIMDEANEKIQTLLSTSDGKAIASFQLPYDNTEPLTQLLPHWRRKEVYKDHWDEAAFIESTRILLQRGAIASPEIYSTDHRPTELYLHFLPFLQGMLYVGNATPLKEDELQLVQNLAEAFSIAYARYEDFNKLEAANIKIEKTLVDLKLAQAQLVQSEKMASLGELTAGIAHEIQNPLNFVNNFSEVSTELIDEMNEEIAKGNLADAKEIANDLKQNLEKINHHGKRAGDIVKGMLQHSRSSTAVKEPVDINALADEYLRLAYHGLRAKDKSFNATLETNYDKTIELINIIPQDIGRVLLNLYNNAFYAVAEKKKGSPQFASGGGADASQNFYEPTVSVSTKKIGNSVEISVTDNGNGIPQKVVDKIFQPFFTTKPTGQGTGLGLSLSYDIVKAHGGEIKVTTKEGEGATLIIHLSII